MSGSFAMVDAIIHFRKPFGKPIAYPVDVVAKLAWVAAYLSHQRIAGALVERLRSKVAKFAKLDDVVLIFIGKP